MYLYKCMSYHQRKGALFSFSVDTCVDERQRVYLSTIYIHGKETINYQCYLRKEIIVEDIL